MKIQIETKTAKKVIEIRDDATDTLLELLQKNGSYVDAPCGGKGTCGRCKVWMNDVEVLACQTTPVADCTVRVPGEQEIAAIDARAEQKTVVWQEASQAEKEEKWGLAVDIGTTTLAMALISLATGKVIATTTSVNHQRSYGADVISRIQAANEGKGELLRACIREDLMRMKEKLCLGIEGAVEQAVIVGNTTMCHLLLGYSCETLGVAPFTPVDIALRNETYGQTKVTILPGISAFVGADIVAGIYDCGMAEQERQTMLLDIGTNGEMAIGDKQGILVTSAAAGPVFEGGNISCGMPGIPGAISRVRMTRNPATGEIVTEYETIGEETPVGLCGSAIIDVMAGLVRLGLVDENGTLAEPWFTEGFPVTGEIRFLQEDIREIQMGKSAIRAGIETLIAERGMPEQVYLAGGFGCYIEEANAIAIGLFPEYFAGKIKAIGNGAINGAIRYLTEPQAKEQVERIAGMADELNLAMHAEFNELYMQYMFF